MMIFDLAPLATELAVLGLALVVFFCDILTKDGSKPWLGWLTSLGLLVILAMTVFFPALGVEMALGDMFVNDGLSRVFRQLFLAAGFLTAVMSIRYLDQAKIHWQGEYYLLLILVTFGMMAMSSSADFVSLYVALELTTIGFYILVSILKNNSPVSSEAGIKYLILGGVSSGVLLYGVSLLYGVTGTTSFAEMGYALAGWSTRGQTGPVLMAAAAMVLTGFAFKVTFAPFHMWAPDVYQAAPTPITGLLSVGSKAAGFAAIIRIFVGGPLEVLGEAWAPLVAALAALTLFIGNLVALKQTSIKRLLAYSSVSQAGYLALGLLAYKLQMGAASMIFYLVLYVFTNMAAFMVCIIVQHKTGTDDIKGFSGMAQTSPVLAMAMMLSLLSLSGIPLTAGFVGKFYLFMAGFAAGWPLLVAWAVISSIIALFYYLQVLKKMYIEPPLDDKTFDSPIEIRVALAVCALFILLMGCYPAPFLTWISNALL